MALIFGTVAIWCVLAVGLGLLVGWLADRNR
jgi:hypothetical protein